MTAGLLEAVARHTIALSMRCVGSNDQGSLDHESEITQMPHNITRVERRDFLKIGSFAIVSVAIAAGKSARAAAPHLDEKDPTAQNLGYKHDAARIDKAKFAKYKTGDTCANCQLYQGKAGEAWGLCPIFSGKEVSAKGWCSAYVKKT